ncbi:DUF397 domain-containing protein [Kitasatospora phosalacinea]|uniref:DUF397 domain-containing protein n=1 Tax=Kitasatospora phosalacinea TaxID=2065 RepID=A0A9W6USF2_9ACTN|nr:DUF397 domain-containing protein [Kitasatospora phosalacinea]GLW58528.1 hypothetical protein Kpho01_65390 [Kitasatospora phosalacinea]
MPDEPTRPRPPKPRDLDLAGAQWLGAADAPEGPQIAHVDGYIVMRHGGDPDAPPLIFDQDEWRAFQDGAANGEFNDLP